MKTAALRRAATILAVKGGTPARDHRRGLPGAVAGASTAGRVRTNRGNGRSTSCSTTMGVFGAGRPVDDPGVRHPGPAQPGAADRPLRHRLPPGPRRAGRLPAANGNRCSTTPRLRDLASSLGGLFWRDLERHHPGIDSLHLAPEVAAAWKQRVLIKTRRVAGPGRADQRGPGTPRRRAAQPRPRSARSTSTSPSGRWRTQPGGAPWAAPCPIRRRGPGPAEGDPAPASRGWTSAPGNGSRSCRRWWRRVHDARTDAAATPAGRPGRRARRVVHRRRRSTAPRRQSDRGADRPDLGRRPATPGSAAT